MYLITYLTDVGHVGVLGPYPSAPTPASFAGMVVEDGSPLLSHTFALHGPLTMQELPA